VGRLVTHALRTSFDELPNDVIELTKTHIIDYIGCALAGRALSKSGAILADVSNVIGGRGESSIIGGNREKVPAMFAALINSTNGYALEFDDGCVLSKSHPGVTTIPAALAVAEREGANGKELITAVALGYDLNIRVGIAISTVAMIKGFAPETSAGIWGATVAAGKLLHLSEEEMASAFGILAVGPMGAVGEAVKDGTLIKEVAPGWATMTGTFAALLADSGLTGPKTILDGKRGIGHAMLQERPNFRHALSRLGRKYMITESAIKPYACCRILHAPIDATIALLEQWEFSSKDVARVDVQTYKYAADNFALNKILRPVQARNSIPYAVAVTMIKRKAGLNEFNETAIKNNEVLKMMHRVRVSHTSEMNKLLLKKNRRVARVTIRLKNRKKLTHFVEYPKGEPKNPLSDEDVERKYRELALLSLEDAGTNQLLAAIRDLESVGNVANLTQLTQK
jgi:2-methylcitrate dehydratase PrpD